MYSKQLIRKRNLVIGDFHSKEENTLNVLPPTSLCLCKLSVRDNRHNMVHTSAFMCVCFYADVFVCVFMGAPVVMKEALHMTYHHSCMCVSGYRRGDCEQYLVPNYHVVVVAIRLSRDT